MADSDELVSAIGYLEGILYSGWTVDNVHTYTIDYETRIFEDGKWSKGGTLYFDMAFDWEVLHATIAAQLSILRRALSRMGLLDIRAELELARSINERAER